MKAQILIVEDDADLREAVKSTAEMGGYTTLCASHGGEALSLLESHGFDAVISDVQMEPVGGHELLKEIRKKKSIGACNIDDSLWVHRRCRRRDA